MTYSSPGDVISGHMSLHMLFCPMHMHYHSEQYFPDKIPFLTAVLYNSAFRSESSAVPLNENKHFLSTRPSVRLCRRSSESPWEVYCATSVLSGRLFSEFVRRDSAICLVTAHGIGDTCRVPSPLGAKIPTGAVRLIHSASGQLTPCCCSSS